MQPEPFRIQPKLDPHQVKTYQIVAPIATHYRTATCQEVDCRAYAHGWRSVIDVATELGVRQFKYITEQSGRIISMTEQVDTQMTLTFPAGQQCFTTHQVPLEREPLYVVRDGDWRGNPRRTVPKRRTADEWVDDFRDHQDKLATEIERG